MGPYVLTKPHPRRPPQVPTEYFTQVLGPQRKYSCCLYNSPSDGLDKAESNMLGAGPRMRPGKGGPRARKS
jgi:cyclopropane-fatty-acyl-phospholipid synthase